MNIKLLASFFMVLFTLAFCHRVLRWTLTRLLHRAPNFAVSHLTCLASFVVAYSLFDADGPFVECFTKLTSCPGLLAGPAQAICLGSDWMAQRHKKVCQGPKD